MMEMKLLVGFYTDGVGNDVVFVLQLKAMKASMLYVEQMKRLVKDSENKKL